MSSLYRSSDCTVRTDCIVRVCSLCAEISQRSGAALHLSPNEVEVLGSGGRHLLFVYGTRPGMLEAMDSLYRHLSVNGLLSVRCGMPPLYNV